MREILFRGKHMANGQWCEGNLAVRKDGVAIITPDDTPCGVYGQVDPETVGQHAGLVDKHGKKIFEGDVVLLRLPAAKMEWRGVCKFHSGAFGLVWRYMAVERFTTFNAICHAEFEVLGNIYDNPEKMEDK